MVRRVWAVRPRSNESLTRGLGSMRSKSIAAVVGALALALPASAMAGNGQAQGSTQWAVTLQEAQSQAQAAQNATNSNAPVNVSSSDVYSGANSANQTTTNGAVSG